MAFTLNRRLAQLVDSNGQLNAGKIPDNEITQAKLHSSFTVTASHLGTSLTPTFGNTTVGSRLTFSSNSHYLETGTNAVAIKSSGGNVYLNATNAGTVINNGLTVNSNITTTGYLAGPSTFTIDPAAVGDNTGTVVIAGNLTVDGTTTTINSTTLDVDDLNITIAKGAANSVAANGAGITIEGPTNNASMTWDHSNQYLEFNKDIFANAHIIGTTATKVGRIINASGVFNVEAYSDRQISFGNVDNGEHVRIDSDGRVGINTTSLDGIFTIKQASSSDVNGLDGIRLNASTGTTYSGFGLVNTTGTLAITAGDAGGTNNTAITFRTATSGSETEKMRITNEGKISIGAGSSPVNLVDVRGGNIMVGGYGSGADHGIVFTPADSASYWHIYNDTSGELVFGRHATVGSGEHARFDNTGSLGIGTTNPAGRLHVQPTNSDTLATAIFTRQSNAAGSDNNTFSLRNDAANNFVEMNSGGTNNGGYKFYTGTFSSSPAMTIVGAGSNGNNVGIGTTSPTEKLTVAGAITTTGALADDRTSTGAMDFSSGITRFVSYGASGTGGIFAFRTASGGASSTERMRIDGSGKVGIGKTPSTWHLDVDSTNGYIASFDGSSNTGVVINSSSGSGDIIGYSNSAGGYNKLNIRGASGTGLVIDTSNNVGVGTTTPAGKLEVHGGRMGIISTSSSWGQLRVANSSVAEVGVTVANGCTGSEFLSDSDPSSSNKFIMGISPYGSGSDTWGIGHGNLGDSVMHIDGSGNFGFGPHTDNPVSYFEISKTRPNVNAPSDYELKLTLNTYGYVGSNYKLGMLQWLGGDTASAQDNFYAGIGATAMDGANHSEEGSLDFHVRNGVSSTDQLAMRIIGKAGTGIAGGGQHAYSVMFPYQGIAIDRVWGGYPGISVFNSAGGGSGTMQSEFRFHGTNSASTAYPSTSGSDFSAAVRADGGFITGSDRRRKKNITTINNALDTVKQLTGKRFQTVNRDGDVQEHVSKNGYQLGFIAQEVEDIIPETIKYHADEDDGTEGWNTAYSMDYAAVVALLVNAIKEQDTTIQDLKSRIETLEG